MNLAVENLDELSEDNTATFGGSSSKKRENKKKRKHEKHRSYDIVLGTTVGQYMQCDVDIIPFWQNRLVRIFNSSLCWFINSDFLPYDLALVRGADTKDKKTVLCCRLITTEM